MRDEEQLYDTIEVLAGVAGAHGVSAAQVALARLGAAELALLGRHVRQV